MGKILLYYLYTTIKDPETMAAWQKELCLNFNLRGRIIIAHEGINGTVGGSVKEIKMYMKTMKTHSLFKEIDFKQSSGGAEHFPALCVKVREEIVTLGRNPRKITTHNTGTHLTPNQAHEMIAQGSDGLVLLDARNDYESRIGTFQGALLPPIKTFKEFPAYIDNNIEKLKNKNILMFCTGGVRCERATAYAKSKGIKKVYQIKGGIHR